MEFVNAKMVGRLSEWLELTGQLQFFGLHVSN